MSNVSVYPFLTGFLSQWHRSDFTVGGIAFGCAEQFMMYRKAVLFDDHEMAARILRAERPSDQKRLGQDGSRVRSLRMGRTEGSDRPRRQSRQIFAERGLAQETAGNRRQHTCRSQSERLHMGSRSRPGGSGYSRSLEMAGPESARPDPDAGP